MSAGLKLQGQFKVDLFDKSGNLLKTSDYVNNFITKSGLNYPLHFAFADCFRFLSVGNGDDPNSIESPTETVELSSPIEGLTYIGGRNNFLDEAENSNYSLPYCGYRFPKENTVELFRGWTLPSKTTTFQSAGTISELMVSPGRPFVEATHNDITKKLCFCEETHGPHKGEDCSSIAAYYNFVNEVLDDKRLKICDATGAFARVILDPPIDYAEDTNVIVTYKLNIVVETGLKYLKLQGASQGPGNFEGELGLLQGVTQLGLKLINNNDSRFINDEIYGPSIDNNNFYVAKKRLQICMTCEAWRNTPIDHCSKCGCATKAKVFTPKGQEACPMGKWTI